MATKTTKGRLAKYTATSLTFRLFAQGSSTVAATYTATTGTYGDFSIAVTEALTGWYDVLAYSGSTLRGVGAVYYASDTAGTYYVDDPTFLTSIQAKTDLIGTGAGNNGSAPVATDGVIAEIIIGDDYLAANGRAFEWTVPAPTGLTLADCTCWFGGDASGAHSGSWIVQGTPTDVGSGNWKLSFDMIRSKTDNCESGLYLWSAAIHGPTGTEITKVRSRTKKTQLVAKQT
jgi:hypothetical protein